MAWLTNSLDAYEKSPISTNNFDIAFAPGSGHEIPDITKKWQALIEQYKNHMVVGEWSGAIQAAEALMKIDPASSQAKFYLAYAMIKTGAKYPEWIGYPSSWAYGSIDDRYYVELAKQLRNSGI